MFLSIFFPIKVKNNINTGSNIEAANICGKSKCDPQRVHEAEELCNNTFAMEEKKE